MDFYEYNLIFNASGFDDLMDPKVLQENYNTTENEVWQFVPAISRGDEPHFVICLIWTMPIEYQLASDLNYEVSCFLVFCLFQNSMSASVPLSSARAPEPRVAMPHSHSAGS